MTTVPQDHVPDNILKDSVLAHVAAAYFSAGKRLELKTQCSATRGFILSTLRGDVTLNQNQIATRLGLDRTVVHRAIKAMKREGLVSEKKANTGRAIQVRLTSKGNAYRKRLIESRKAADEAVKRQMNRGERETLIRLLQVVADCEF